jgi:hypothetical protein
LGLQLSIDPHDRRSILPTIVSQRMADKDQVDWIGRAGLRVFEGASQEPVLNRGETYADVMSNILARHRLLQQTENLLIRGQGALRDGEARIRTCSSDLLAGCLSGRRDTCFTMAS